MCRIHCWVNQNFKLEFKNLSQLLSSSTEIILLDLKDISLLPLLSFTAGEPWLWKMHFFNMWREIAAYGILGQVR